MKEDGSVNEALRLLYDHIQAWLCRNDADAPYEEIGDKDGSGILMERIASGSEADYIRAQAEALAYLGWLKKFAVAFHSGEGDRP